MCSHFSGSGLLGRHRLACGNPHENVSEIDAAEHSVHWLNEAGVRVNEERNLFIFPKHIIHRQRPVPPQLLAEPFKVTTHDRAKDADLCDIPTSWTLQQLPVAVYRDQRAMIKYSLNAFQRPLRVFLDDELLVAIQQTSRGELGTLCSELLSIMDSPNRFRGGRVIRFEVEGVAALALKVFSGPNHTRSRLRQGEARESVDECSLPLNLEEGSKVRYGQSDRRRDVGPFPGK